MDQMVHDSLFSELRGLDLENTKVMNCTLLGKWWWRFNYDHNSLWTKLIRNQRSRQGLGSEMLAITRGWRSVRENIIYYGMDFTSSFVKKLGDGSSILFWLDNWVRHFRLCDVFPRLLSLEKN